LSKIYFVTDGSVALHFVGPDLVAALRAAGSSGLAEDGSPFLPAGRQLLMVEAEPWVADMAEVTSMNVALAVAVGEDFA
jgi:hypothetical protein